MNKKGKIRKKFFKYFILCTLIPVVIFVIVASMYISMNNIKAQQEYMVSRMKNAAYELDSLLLEVSQIGHMVSEDEYLQESLEKKHINQKEYYSINGKASETLLYVSKYFDKNLQVYVIGENKGRYKSGYRSFKNENFIIQDWYQTVKNSDEETWFDIREDSFVSNSVNEKYLSFGIPIHDSKSKSFLGVVLVEAKVNQVFQEILNREEEKIYLLNPKINMEIIGDKVEIYQDNNVIAVDKTVKSYMTLDKMPTPIAEALEEIKYWKDDFSEEGTIADNNYYASYIQISANNEILVSLIEKNKLYKNIYEIVGCTIAFLIPLFVLIYYVSSRLSKSVSNPIEVLKSKVEQVQNGNLEVCIQKVSDDEIGELGEQFNQMVIDIKSLMEGIRTEQEKLRSYELMLLQAQINPHFLYNTLDSLCWLIRMDQSEDALKMTNALTRFFVTGLNAGKDIISLSKEMENIKSYLTIQQLRYKSKLDYYIYCEKDTEEFQVPKLILQPFVENALYHGIKGKEDGGIIEVRSYKADGKIWIKIVDDGLGMNRESLDLLCHELKNVETEKTDSYGIKNVNERLQLFYKDSYTLEIQSELGIGTFVTISIKEEQKCTN